MAQYKDLLDDYGNPLERDEGDDYDMPTNPQTPGWWNDSPADDGTTGGINQIVEGLKSEDLITDGINILDKVGNFVAKVSDSGVLAEIVQGLLQQGLVKDNSEMMKRLEQAAISKPNEIADEIGRMSGPELEALAKDRPDLLPLIQQAQTEYNKINVGPEGMAAAKGSLAQLEDVSKSGYGPIERAAAARVLGEMANRNQAEQAAIKSDLASRGQYGAGNEMTARMLATQANANAAYTQGLDIEAQAAKRALDAIRDKGRLGVDVNKQEFDQQAEAARAQDVINKFNAEMGQKVGEVNLGQQNLQQLRQMDARKQEYQNELDKQKARTTAAAIGANNAGKLYGDVYKADTQAKEARNKMIGDFLKPTIPTPAQTPGQTPPNQPTTTPNVVGTPYKSSGIGEAAGGAIGSIFGSTWAPVGQKVGGWLEKKLRSDEDVKTDKKEMTDEEISCILDKLVPMSYKYQDTKVNKGQPKGKVVGIMAQQIEKTPVKGMVSMTNGVKDIDSMKALSLALASLGSLNNRVKKLEG